MILTIEPTTKVVHLDGVQARIWEGHTDKGVPVHVYIARVAVEEGMAPEVYQDFERELMEQRTPSPAIQAIPLRLIL